MRCDRLLVVRANHRDRHKRRSPPDRGIDHLSGRGGTSPRISASAAVRWDTHKPVAQSQIRRFRSSHQVGTCSQIINNSGTPIPHRKTPFRPGPHPYRSECHSSSSADSAHKASASESTHSTTICTADSATRNSVLFLDHDNTTGPTSVSIVRTTNSSAISDRGDTEPVETTETNPPINRPETAPADHVDDAVLQFSGTGDWFLEGWIGDHSVDFVVDSLYQILVYAGAPVGVLGCTSMTLRGANGTGIGVSGCSHCVMSFMGLLPS